MNTTCAAQLRVLHTRNFLIGAALLAITVSGAAQPAELQGQRIAAASASVKSPSMAGEKQPGRASHSERVEARITELRGKLKIMPEQEAQWNELTQIMRDNARDLDSLAAARAQNHGRMTAVEDLRSYSQMADAHAEGLKRFVPAFEALYASMSDAQKKQADATFNGSARIASRGAARSRS